MRSTILHAARRLSSEDRRRFFSGARHAACAAYRSVAGQSSLLDVPRMAVCTCHNDSASESGK